TNWTTTFSTVDPNQGDYLGLCAREATPLVAWTDGRVISSGTTESDPNVFMAPDSLDCAHAPVSGGNNAGSTKDHMVVNWSAQTALGARLFRRGAGATVDLGDVTADAGGQIVYQDAGVLPGVTYSYWLEVEGYCEPSVCELRATLPCDAAPVALVSSNGSPD